MAPRAQVPVLLLTGFPGRAKTSLLAHGVAADEIVHFITARLAISAMRSAGNSTGAHA